MGKMRRRRTILLTGATGLLGRYLLRDLLLARRDVAVLARDQGPARAAARVADLVAFWSDSLHVRLPRPLVLAGDVRLPDLGLDGADRAWLGRSRAAVLHAAAHVGFQATPDGEPSKTNRDGVRHLLCLCRAFALDLHHVSTAFVCGRRTGTIREDDLEHDQGFHNDYERSKYEAERLLRDQGDVRVTIYRPSVIVGDSRTGYTSTYHGLYRFLEAADRLAQPGAAGRRSLALRLPLDGAEPHNLVPVDWVSSAITRLLEQPERHGATYHLAAGRPLLTGDLKAVAEEVLGLEDVTLAGSAGPTDPTALEELFLASVRDYWPYRGGEPCFDLAHTRAALPSLPPPVLDRDTLSRLVRFAVADRWGRGQRPPAHAALDCARYVEEFFPEAVRRSALAGLPLDVSVGLDVQGPGGGQWTCRWVAGQMTGVYRGAGAADVVYRMNPATFAEVVAGRLLVQEAFFARRIDIEGDVEKGLKLALLFAHLVRESPYVEVERARSVPA
jgi:thioester reductase-like protein